MKNMKTSVLLLAMSLFISCSTNEIVDPNNGGSTTPEVDPSQLNFKTIDLNLNTKEGYASGSETRSASDVDDLGRPKGAYPLKEIFLVSEGESKKEMKKMQVVRSSKIAYAFIDEHGNPNESTPTHVYITPLITKDDPSTGVMVKLSVLKKEIEREMNLEDIDKGDMFYYSSTDQKTVSLPRVNDSFCKELGDVLFSSAQFYLVLNKKEKTLVAFKIDKDYQMAFPANEPGTEAGGLWPIFVNRTGAAITIRYMVTGDYYNNNTDNSVAMAAAFEEATGFPMNSLYSEQAYIENFPSSFDVENGTVVAPSDPSKRGNLLIYDVDKKVTEMTKIQFKYAEASKEISSMGLATTEIPFVYPMTFKIANSFNISIGVQHNGADVKMNFSIKSSNDQYSLTANTNTIFYLKMTTSALKGFYDEALKSSKTRSNAIATFELPSSALEVVQSAN